MSTNCTVTIKKQEKEERYELRKGLSLQALAARSSTELEFNCRKADCGICIVRVRSGHDNLSPCKEIEADFLRAMHAEPDERLACQCRVYGDVGVEVEFL